MGHRIFLLVIGLGSIIYGALAMGAAVRHWQQLPQAVATLEQQASPVARTQAQYLQSPWHHGALALTFLTGALFAAGAFGLWRRRPWSRHALFGGAWVALAHMAWTFIASVEWFHGSGAGMAYQVNLLNIGWVLFILAVSPTERVARGWA